MVGAGFWFHLNSPEKKPHLCMEAQASGNIPKSSEYLWARCHHSQHVTQTRPLVSGGSHTGGQPESDVGMYLAQRNSENLGMF